MKHGPNSLSLLLLALSAGVLDASAAGTAGGGAVIYKEFAFDSDAQAEMANYSSIEHFASVDNVRTAGGQTLRILPGQQPIYIPQAGTPGSTKEQAAGTILAAEKRFPQFVTKLETYRRAWAAAPVVQPHPSPAAAQAAPAADSVGNPPVDTSASAGRPSDVLHTKEGETYRSWKVSGMEGDNVVISHADGISRVPIAELPDNLWGFPPEVIARLQQLRQQPVAQAPMDSMKATSHAANSTHSRRRHDRPWDEE